MKIHKQIEGEKDQRGQNEIMGWQVTVGFESLDLRKKGFEKKKK